jgi:hypothetical protein
MHVLLTAIVAGAKLRFPQWVHLQIEENGLRNTE